MTQLLRIFSAALLCAALPLAAGAGEESSTKPETAWLTSDLLLQWVKDLGYTGAKNAELNAVELKLANTGNIVFASFADSDSLKLAASWDSTQKELGDSPIANGWNNERRFCKISIAQKPDEAGTLLVMHFDQLLPTSTGKDAVFNMVKKSLELFETGVTEFDMFSKDTYRAWTMQMQQQKEEEED